MSQKEREQLHAEFSILSTLRHPNIVGYYHREHLKTSQDLHLYMEYCGNGDLGRYIKELKLKNRYAEEPFVWSMFSQLVTALYRCHYGVDPPELGSNVMGLGNAAKPQQGGMMILHRDLKPENVFLGEDNSVKLGDFGLSKILLSHDFASTYVGTPFYMSPEICAAERYTLKSDIWSLGCIIYELCTREPPFNAKSHFDLIQRIKEGKIGKIPGVYSPELTDVIKSCLKVNPDRRPDTAQLVNLPIVRLMRKEKEVVEMGKLLKTKEERIAQRLLEAEARLKRVDTEKVILRQEMEAIVRREWEVKARLEIDRQVQLEIERLKAEFDSAVQKAVEAELMKRLNAQSTSESDNLCSSVAPSDVPRSSVCASDDLDFPSTTDLTELSIDSPEPTKARKSTRTPFGRAQTMFAGTPMDVEMGEPSPISIASLSLSPRRNGDSKAPIVKRNIFAVAAEAKERSELNLNISDTDDEEDVPVLPSPTRQKSSKNPFKPASARPTLITQRTAPTRNMQGQSNPFAPAKAITVPTIPTLSTQPELRSKVSSGALKERSSPHRRLSKIPSSSNLNDGISSPTRKPNFTRKAPNGGSDSADLSKLALKNTMAMKTNIGPKGRTLVELAQARAGGRPVDANGYMSDEGSPKGKRFADRLAQREPATWDPERDDMPSPFLIRNRQPLRRM